jgi:hypothetical protein
MFHRSADSEFQRFVQGVEQCGMPVGFLRTVGQNYRLLFSQTDTMVTRNRDTLWLKQDMMRVLPKTISPEPPFGEQTVILTLYHEATHAYFDIMKDTPRIKALVRKGEEYYRGAPTTVPGHEVQNPERVTQEAAGMYMEHRAASWWAAFEQLVLLGQKAIADSAAAATFDWEVQSIAARYDQAMAKTRFGYEPAGKDESTQIRVNKPIFPELKQFLDSELLEDKIPDLFHQVRYFQDLIYEVKRLAVLPQPAGMAQ